MKAGKRQSMMLHDLKSIDIDGPSRKMKTMPLVDHLGTLILSY